MVGPHTILNGLHGVGLARADSQRLSPSDAACSHSTNRSALQHPIMTRSQCLANLATRCRENASPCFQNAHMYRGLSNLHSIVETVPSRLALEGCSVQRLAFPCTF